MSRKFPLIWALVLLLACAAFSNAWGQSAKQKREAVYQAALQSYSDALKPGMTRKNVEDYFRSKGIAFQQLCCIFKESAFADLVKIGKEKHPWYCSEHNVYVAFRFTAVKPDESETLKTITVFHRLEGCL
jgi:hypothetical protein